jgi:hypothetical protein
MWGAGVCGGGVRHPVALTATLSSIILVWWACACALDPSLDVNQYASTTWKVREGFAKGEINAIAETLGGLIGLKL